MRRRILWIMLSLLALVASACGSTDDVRERVERVDEAVGLLQEIETDGTWQTLTDGLDALAAQDGYTAALHLIEGAAAVPGEFDGEPEQDSSIEMQVDAAGNAHLRVTTSEHSAEYYLQPGDTDQPGSLYRVEDGRYSCANGDDESRLFRAGIDSLFAEYALGQAGAQLLSVVNEEGEEMVAGRAATRYTLESIVPEALDILEAYEDDALQAALDASESLDLTGDLALDDETGALLRFDSTYYHAGQAYGQTFNFEVTQWGGVPDLPPPAADAIERPCP